MATFSPHPRPLSLWGEGSDLVIALGPVHCDRGPITDATNLLSVDPQRVRVCLDREDRREEFPDDPAGAFPIHRNGIPVVAAAAAGQPND